MMLQGITTVPQLRPSCCIDFSAKQRPTNLGCSVLLGHINTSKVSTFFTNRTRKLSNLHCCHCSNKGTNQGEAASALEWDWNRWTRHFSEVEQAESFASLLKVQLEEAIEKQDFQEAAKLKLAIIEANSKDSVTEIMSQLKNAIDEERYHDASRLNKCSGSGLVGWWVGYSKDANDPFGRLVRITPGVGRFIGRSYTPRQLLNASPGTPMFEIFVVKDADETYVMQVVCLQRAKGSSTNPTNAPSKSVEVPSASEVKDPSVGDMESEVKSERSDGKNANIEGATEEGVKGVINFLKDKIPGLKVKVMNVDVTEENIEDADSVKQLMQEHENEAESGEDSEDEADKLEEIRPDGVALGGSSDSSEDAKDLDMKLFIGGVVHNEEDVSAKDEYVRLPAEIKDMERESFVLHIPEKSLEYGRAERKVSKVKVAAIAAKGVSELMPPDVAKAFLGADKVSSKVSRDIREIVKLAVSQAQKQNILKEYTNFSRITTSNNTSDPFDGLYIGAFGPYGMDVVQLTRKYGHWNNADESSADGEFFEYVEAVKLTGDLNVPAGQVTIRAKIGKGSRNSNRGMFPDELGVVASYKGQGRIVQFGFKNPQWVDGELLLLNGKGIGPYVKGADLGFLYVLREQSFLVLFNKLKLPD